ncbi:MAG: Ku protein [Proteobacteria bacterium]|nr:Ku protein [Pseudomonadota bacterium]MDA1058404.1 Ku protein [Pseudomonadota bacterium]
MAPRATWKGYLKLSLVSCPVRMYNATSDTAKIRFNMLHKDTNNRVQMKPHDPELGVVERSDLVKGYEFEKDRYVVIDDEDLDQIQIESTKTISIEKFVDMADVDPMYLDSPYYIAPDGPVADETYRVMQMAMKERDKAALARVVMSGRERLVLLIPRDNGFVLNTLRTAAEVRHHAEYFAEIGDGKLDATAVKLANQLIEQFEGELDTSQFVDYYQEALTEVVKAKVKGTTPVIAKAPERGQVINLMDALKRSIDEGDSKKPPAKSQSRKKTKTGAKATPKAKKKKVAGAAG